MVSEGLIRFIKDFSEINPHPTKQQIEWLGMALGFEPRDMGHFITAARKKITALTKEERVLINDFDPLSTSPDHLIMLDGDDTSTDPGMQSALGVDGIEYIGEDSDQRALSMDGR